MIVYEYTKHNLTNAIPTNLKSIHCETLQTWHYSRFLSNLTLSLSFNLSKIANNNKSTELSPHTVLTGSYVLQGSETTNIRKSLYIMKRIR
jgi:hypothetical protein